MVVRSFGRRWTQPYDASLTLTRYNPNTICYRRNDNGYIFCEDGGGASTVQAVTIVRGNGQRLVFAPSGNGYINDADVNDRVTPAYAGDGTTILGWTYIAADGDSTERYDANGKLLTITTRGGNTRQITYSSGASNDTSAGRYPATAPICPNIQPGPPLPAGQLLCVTNTWGRQIQFEYDNQSRISKALDPNGQAYLYAYDGPSGGCTTFSGDTSNLACTANNLTSVTYPDSTTRTYYYNEAAQINNGAACANMTVIGNGFGHLRNALTGIVDETGRATPLVLRLPDRPPPPSTRAAWTKSPYPTIPSPTPMASPPPLSHTTWVIPPTRKPQCAPTASKPSWA